MWTGKKNFLVLIGWPDCYFQLYATRDSTGVHHCKKSAEAIFLLVILGWLTPRAINCVTYLRWQRSGRFNLYLDLSGTVLYNLTRPQNVLPSKRQIWCYLLKGALWKLSFEVKKIVRRIAFCLFCFVFLFFGVVVVVVCFFHVAYEHNLVFCVSGSLFCQRTIVEFRCV